MLRLLGVLLVAGGLAIGAAAAARAAQPAGAAGPPTVPSRGTPAADSWADTLHVAAPRVTLDEIIADIGRRQRADRDSLRSVAFTAVVTTVRTPDGQAPAGTDTAGWWEVEETALRYHQDRGRPDRVVRLWQRKQKVTGGVPAPAEEKPAAKPQWRPSSGDMVQDLPFAEGAAALYRYELVRSTMVGGSLVHVVAFAPRDRFAALPSGTIWVDIADWAIRRVEASFADAVPFPWIVRAIPRYRLRQAPCGNVWFPVLETAAVTLRNLPFLDSGGTYDLRVELRDIVVNGEPCDGAEALVEAGDEASAAYWAGIDADWQAELPAALLKPGTLTPARLDSLSQAGAELLSALPEQPPWRLRPRVLPPAYNRSQGVVLRGGLRFGRAAGASHLDADVGPGLSDRRVEWGLGLTLQPHAALTLRAKGERSTGAFAGDGRPGQRSWAALLWGADPNHYFDRDAWSAGVRWQPADAPWLEVAAAEARELPLAVHTQWNVLGRGLSPEGMRAADAVDARTARVGAGFATRLVALEAGVARHGVTPRVPVADGAERQVNEWRWSARLRRPDGLGNRWTLRTGGRGLDGPAPAQQRVWLGDWQPADDGADLATAGALSGWPAGTLLGDRGAWASLAVDLNLDPWRMLRVPGLRGLRLQPMLFAEWAGAWGTAGDAWAAGEARDGDGTPPTGSRADLGLGFSRRVDLPLAGVGSRFEVRAARAVGQGAGEQGWRVLVGFVR